MAILKRYLPKHEEIKQFIIQQINDKNYRPHNMIPSEAELCRMFSASRGTVRRALNDLAIQGVIYQVQGKGTFVEDPIKLNESPGIVKRAKVGLVLPFISDTFLSRIVIGVESALAQRDIALILCHTEHDQKVEEEKITQLIDEGVAGIILYTADCPPEEKDLNMFLEQGIPFVFIDRYIEGLHGDRVIGEDFDGGYQAAVHLMEHGYTRIGFFNCDRAAMTPTLGRIAGLTAALQEKGLSVPAKRIVDKVAVAPGLKYEQLLQADKVRIAEYLTENDDLEAVITNNDYTAIKFYSVCRELGLAIPGDLAIIGFCDMDIDPLLHPQLTSFDQNPEMLSRKAVELIIRRIEEKGMGNDSDIVVRIPYKLMLRESCGCNTASNAAAGLVKKAVG
ncbi:MAG: GntR family transcriptional regulator [Firmicutes bacterium]|nr:GntR family transcriptional regulator [Bacillota bacterium]